MPATGERETLNLAEIVDDFVWGYLEFFNWYFTVLSYVSVSVSDCTKAIQLLSIAAHVAQGV